jgi:hypothetical protein
METIPKRELAIERDVGKKQRFKRSNNLIPLQFFAFFRFCVTYGFHCSFDLPPFWNGLLHGALVRLERSAGKLARSVLRGVRPLTVQEITSKKLRLDNSVRATQQAERLGKSLGLKLADKSSASANQKRMTDQLCDLW